MPAFKSRIELALSQRKEQGLNRSLNLVFAGNQSILEHDGKRYINFSSNDYLGLANDQALIRAWQQGLSVYGSGSGASPMVTGFSAAHSNLEAALTEWLGYERAILLVRDSAPIKPYCLPCWKNLMSCCKTGSITLL